MPSTPDLRPRLEFALNVAREASQLILRYYRSQELAVDIKGDQTPVTAADRGAEELIRKRIAEAFAGDGVLGEEFGDTPSKNGYRWILDPVDGTKPFVAGVPLFGTLIGLEHDGRMVLGVCRFPALDEVMYAAQGTGAWWQIGTAEPRRARVSSVSKLSDAVFCVTDVKTWGTIERFDAFETLRDRSRICRGWGDCYGHMLVATGRAEVMVDPMMAPWDAAALQPILEESGGHFSGWNGEPSPYAGSGVSTNAALRDEVMTILKPRAK
jgi:histidinol-phosphatase